MEGIVKISRLTANAVGTLTRDEFIYSEKLAEEGTGEENAMLLLDKIVKEKVLWTPHWVYVYIADQRGKMYAAVRPAPKPVLLGNKTV